MKKIIFLFLSISFYSNSWCKCVINCSVHYWKEAKTEVSNGGGGIDVFNEIPAQWSPLYTVSVIFYSGYEYNESTSENTYDNNSIIAVIAWDNGGDCKFTGVTQADETYVGGKNKFRHYDKKVPHSGGRSTKDKTPVFGLLNNGHVSMAVVPDTKAKTLQPIITNMVAEGSILVTDEYVAYYGLDKKYKREIVHHNANEYKSVGGLSTNGLEGFWSLLKRGIYGIYHQVSAKHLNQYCDEFAYRYNTRDVSDSDRFNLSIVNADERLTYKALIGKA